MKEVSSKTMVFCFQNCSDVRKNCSSDREKLFKFGSEDQEFCKFSAFSLKFKKLFSTTRTIFSHSRSEQFWKQNTIVLEEKGSRLDFA